MSLPLLVCFTPGLTPSPSPTGEGSGKTCEIGEVGATSNNGIRRMMLRVKSTKI